jgi:hypothetical protein
MDAFVLVLHAPLLFPFFSYLFKFKWICLKLLWSSYTYIMLTNYISRQLRGSLPRKIKIGKMFGKVWGVEISKEMNVVRVGTGWAKFACRYTVGPGLGRLYLP